jgi:ABC-type Fe3+ transport system permease subunit
VPDDGAHFVRVTLAQPVCGPGGRGYPAAMTIAIVIAVCVLLLVLGFLVPRLSRHPQRGVDRTLSVGQRAGGKAPGIVGRLFSKSFGTTRKATNRSAGAGRKARGKMPL